MTAVSSSVQWLEGLFDDVTTRIRLGVMWSVDAEEPPLTVQVQPADRPTMSLVLGADGSGERRAFAAELQGMLNPLLGVALPPCPTHGIALEAVEIDRSVFWHCREGDFSCAIGDYKEALWPPGPDDPTQNLGSLLGHHLKRRGVMRGVAGWSVRRHDGALVGDITLRPDADEVAIREAAAPVELEVSRIGPVTTVRLDEPATDQEPAKRVLTIRGAPMHLARLRGTLRRALPEDDCDVIVGRTRVRLAPDHRLGGRGEPLVFDPERAPFADEGDEVICVGGLAPPSHVEGRAGIFVAGKLCVYERSPSE